VANTIQVKRGTEAQIDTAGLAHGEFAIATDTDEVWIGTAASLIKISTNWGPFAWVYNSEDGSLDLEYTAP